MTMICKLIHKKCPYKSDHSDEEYHMTLNTIFSVVRMTRLFHDELEIRCRGMKLSPTKSAYLNPNPC